MPEGLATFGGLWPSDALLGGHNALFYVSAHFYIKVTLSTNLAVILIHSTKLRSRYWNVTVITLPGFGVISVGKLGSWSLFKRICDFRFPNYDINPFLFLGVTFNGIPRINYPSSYLLNLLNPKYFEPKCIILPCLMRKIWYNNEGRAELSKITLAGASRSSCLIKFVY